LVDKEGMALVKDKVVEVWAYIGRVKTDDVVLFLPKYRELAPE